MGGRRIGVAVALFGIARTAPAQACDEAHRCVMEWTVPSSMMNAGPKLVADGVGQVYFANVGSVSLTTRSASPLSVAGMMTPCGGEGRVDAFDVAASRVLWAAKGNVCSGPRYGSNAPNAVALLARGAPGDAIVALAANDAWVAYSVHLGDGASQVRAIPLDGSPSVVVARVAAPLVALFGAQVYWVEGTTIRSAQLASVRAITTAGPTVNVGTASARVVQIQVGAAGVFASTEMAIERIVSHAAIVSEHVERFALDGAMIYWTSARRGIVAKTSAFGGPPTILATRVHPAGIAVDGANAFFVEHTLATTAIMRISPK